jgi:predicted alpha/beta superfamily hydrolase
MTFAIQALVEQFELTHPNGTDSFTISVSRKMPLAEGATDVPILLVLDADIEFALAAEIARFRGIDGFSPTAMVVGVGYSLEFAEFAKRRTGDLTPPSSEAGRTALGSMSKFIGEQDGGAEAFLTFLLRTLLPEILNRYPEASKTQQILFGHSLGGLFAAYALLTRPEAFSSYIISSPSLWWDRFAVLANLPALKERLLALTQTPRVFIGVGGLEQEPPTKVPPVMEMSLEALQALVASCRMVDAAAELATTLRETGLEDVTYVAFEDEDHSSVVAAVLTRGLRFAVPAAD